VLSVGKNCDAVIDDVVVVVGAAVVTGATAQARQISRLNYRV